MSELDIAEGDAAKARPTRVELSVGILVVLLALATCIPAAALLSGLWTGSQFWGHAYAVPLVALLILYHRRIEFLNALARLEPSSGGAFVLFGAATLEFLMLVGDVGFAAALAVPLVIGSSLYAVGGRSLMRPAIVPLMFLATVVPPPRFATYELLSRLKLLVTDLAVSTLQALGHTVLAEGNMIVLPEATLFVADACSGLTSLIALVPIAGVVAYFLGRGIWRRVLIVASVVPLAMIANLFRVVLTVMMVSDWGVEASQGALHESFGLATSVIGTIAVVGVARVLR